jgi:hypothetical protein
MQQKESYSGFVSPSIESNWSGLYFPYPQSKQLSSCKLWQTLHHHTGASYILKKNTYRKKPHLASSQGRKIELNFLSDTKLKPTKIYGQVATQFYMGVKGRMISVKRQMRENPKKQQSWNILAGITAASSLHTVFALQESKE